MLKKIIFVVLLTTSLTTEAQQNDIEQFNWLNGLWQGTSGEGKLEETWQKKSEYLLEGQGYYILNEDTVVREYMRFEKINQYWCFIAVINEKPPILFHLIENGPEKWVFENKEHDFPQRVVYSKTNNGTLLAWIEGISNGKPSKETYELHRVK